MHSPLQRENRSQKVFIINITFYMFCVILCLATGGGFDVK